MVVLAVHPKFLDVLSRPSLLTELVRLLVVLSPTISKTENNSNNTSSPRIATPSNDDKSEAFQTEVNLVKSQVHCAPLMSSSS